MKKIFSINFTLLIMIIALIGILTGCTATQPKKYPMDIERALVEIERLRNECVKCESELPGQCNVGTIGKCSEIFK